MKQNGNRDRGFRLRIRGFGVVKWCGQAERGECQASVRREPREGREGELDRWIERECSE